MDLVQVAQSLPMITSRDTRVVIGHDFSPQNAMAANTAPTTINDGTLTGLAALVDCDIGDVTTGVVDWGVARVGTVTKEPLAAGEFAEVVYADTAVVVVLADVTGVDALVAGAIVAELEFDSEVDPTPGIEEQNCAAAGTT